ncbi:hypothetical protein BGZ70_004729, partial [Mortierella alpina]
MSMHQDDLQVGSCKVVTVLLLLDVPAVETRKRTALPKSFQDRLRHMQQLYQDSMAVVCIVGEARFVRDFKIDPTSPEM